MNLDSPAGKAMIEAGADGLCGGLDAATSPNTVRWDRETARIVLAAAFAATVKCAACGGSGNYLGGRESWGCLPCGGTGRRLAIKEALDE